MRTTIAGLAMSVVLIGSGCQIASNGARCRPGSAPARDEQWVLVCTDGRWARSITIADAVERLFGGVPGKLLNLSSFVDTTTTDVVSFTFYVEGRTGKPLAGARVQVTGPGLTGTGIAVTGDNGYGTVTVGTTVTPGTYTMTATVIGTDLTVQKQYIVAAAKLSRLVVAQGNDQTVRVGQSLAPVSISGTDDFGRARPDVDVDVTTTTRRDGVVVAAGGVRLNPDGEFTWPAITPTDPGRYEVEFTTYPNWTYASPGAPVTAILRYTVQP